MIGSCCYQEWVILHNFFYRIIYFPMIQKNILNLLNLVPMKNRKENVAIADLGHIEQKLNEYLQNNRKKQNKTKQKLQRVQYVVENKTDLS